MCSVLAWEPFPWQASQPTLISAQAVAKRSSEQAEYPKNPEFRARFGPRGVLKCVATSTDTPGDDPRFGPWGKQRCEDTIEMNAQRTRRSRHAAAPQQSAAPPPPQVTVAKPVSKMIADEDEYVGRFVAVESVEVRAREGRLLACCGADRRPDAQVQVQNRVSIAQPRIPLDVRNIGVTTTKSSPDLMMVVHLYSPDRSRDALFISNYATVPAIIRWPGLVQLGDVVMTLRPLIALTALALDRRRGSGRDRALDRRADEFRKQLVRHDLAVGVVGGTSWLRRALPTGRKRRC
jgi:hypothetical protein